MSNDMVCLSFLSVCLIFFPFYKKVKRLSLKGKFLILWSKIVRQSKELTLQGQKKWKAKIGFLS